MRGTAILKKEPIIGASFAERTSLAESTRCTTRKSVVQYPIDCTAANPNTIAIQWTPIGLLPAELIGPHMWVKSWPGNLS